MTLRLTQCHQNWLTMMVPVTGLEPPFNGISEFICELLDVVSER